MFGRQHSDKTKNQAPARRRTSSGTPERATAADLSSRYAFRRNRTLTGSSSAQVASSNELNAELRSPRAHVHHLTNLRRRLLTYFLMVVAVSFGLYVLVSQLVATTAISVVGQPSINSEDAAAYATAVESYFGARPSERFRFLLDKPAFLSHIRATRPEVHTIAIEPGSQPGEASVVIQPRKPIARWSIAGSNQYVDGEGVVFSRNYFDEPELQIVDQTGLGAASSTLVASDRFLGFIGLVVAKAERYGLPVSTITIPAQTSRQVAVSLKGKGPTQYRLSVDRSPGEQVEDVTRISRYLDMHHITPGYVDVRLAGKAYYK